MAEESFLLMSLKEEKSKKLAQVISNETSRKILDFMGTQGSKTITETEIARALKLPISTVHYNMKHLIKAKLVNADEFHYSEKGKEVNHYSLSNKLIVIAPSTSEKFMEKLKKVLPVALFALIAAGFIQIFSKYFLQGRIMQKAALAGTELMRGAPAMKTAAEAAVETAEADIAALGIEAVAPEAAADAVTGAAEAAGAAVNETIANATTTAAQPVIQYISSVPASTYAIWFLFGALFTLILYFIWDWVRDRKK